jgi:O-antigen ligase
LKVAAATLVILGMGVAYYAAYAPEDYVERLASVREDQGTGRSDLWKVAFEIVDDRPLHGVGAGNFPLAEARYATSEVDIARIDLVLDKSKVVHNTYLGVLSELGFVGLTLFLCLVVGALASAVRAVQLLRGHDWPLQLLIRGFFVALVGILAAYTFASAEYEKQLWLLIGTALALPALAARRAKESAR